MPDPAGLAAVDLTNPQTWNRYAYVANNPLSTVDPLGMYCALPLDYGHYSVGCGNVGMSWGSGEWGVGQSDRSSTEDDRAGSTDVPQHTVVDIMSPGATDPESVEPVLQSSIDGDVPDMLLIPGQIFQGNKYQMQFHTQDGSLAAPGFQVQQNVTPMVQINVTPDALAPNPMYQLAPDYIGATSA